MVISEDYKIITDDLNFMLMKKYVKKKKKGEENKPDEYGFRVCGYYPSIKSALKDMVAKEIREDGFKDFESIVSKIDELEETIENLNL